MGEQQHRTAAASEASRHLGAVRTINDPARLARAARAVRLAIAEGKLTLADLKPAKPGKGA